MKRNIASAGLWLLARTTSALVDLDQKLLGPTVSPAYSRPARIAVIGAGSAGALTAYYLSEYYANASLPAPDVTVFERNAYIGGRSTIVFANDDPSVPIELGASIFVSVNHNLVSAMRRFNLSTDGSVPLTTADSHTPDLGIWNGREFVLTLDKELTYRDYARMVWRYGLAPYRTLRLMKSTVARFLDMYEAPHFPFPSLSEVVHRLGLVDATAVTGADYLASNGIRGRFGDEVVQASTRVNYAMNLGRIHGLEAMVCMATDGAMSVDGGNWRIFAAMLEASGAEVRLGHEVTAIARRDVQGDGAGWSLKWRHDAGAASGEDSFDHVVLAAPFQFADIDMSDGTLDRMPDGIPYVRLHVTLFTSRHALSPRAFGLEDGSRVPSAVLTTVADDGTEPGFLSISRLREIAVRAPSGEMRVEHVYKIFSPRPVDDAFLVRILGLSGVGDEACTAGGASEGIEPPATRLCKDHVSWIHRKEWDSYPVESPRVTFEESRLAENFWYTSGIEGFISTMETSSLMGKNIARMIFDQERGNRK